MPTLAAACTLGGPATSLDEALALLLTPSERPTAGYTLEQAMDDLLEVVRTHNAPGTLKAYLHCATRLRDCFGGRELTGITTADLQAYQGQRLSESQPATVRQERAFLSRVFKTAMKNGHCPCNPMASLDGFRVDNAKELWLDEPTEARLVAAMKRRWPTEPHNGLIVRLAVLTGMRRMELFSLERCHVRLDAGEVHLPRTKTGQRWIALGNEACRVIRALLDAHTEPYVIPSIYNCKSRSLLAHCWVSRRFKAAACDIGLPALRLHDLRHTTASRLLNAGAQLYDVSRLLGHSGLQTTQRYAHHSMGRMRDVANLIGQEERL